jgi:hypothetical protein
MAVNDRAAWRPRRFDVAGAHPDEVYRAVGDVFGAVGEMRRQYESGQLPGAREVNVAVARWEAGKPLRFGNCSDAQVQRFLAQGVRIMDVMKEKLPLGISESHRQVRNRCDELAKSMEKVLARRPDEYRRGVTRGRGRSM